VTLRILRRALVYLALGLAAYVSVFPFYWMMVGATNTSADIIKGKAGFGTNLFVNVANLFAQVDMPRIFWNSAEIAVVATFLTLLVSSLAGYGFEIFRSKASERVFAVLLLMLSIPFAAIMVPLFVTMAQLHLINTYVAVSPESPRSSSSSISGSRQSPFRANCATRRASTGSRNGRSSFTSTFR
jgi:lactose/L-arabinose transport system permease protein